MVRMRIAQVFKDLRVNMGGVNKVVHLISKELARTDDVDVIIAGPVEKGIEGGYKLHQLPKAGLTNPRLRKFLQEHDYDVVHVHGYNTFLPYDVTKVASSRGFPVVFTPHFHPIGNHPTILRKAFDRVYGRYSLKNSDIITVLSRIEREQMMTHGVEEARIRSVPNPLDPDMLTKASGDMARKRFRLVGKIVLFVGRLDMNKGLMVLLEAFDGLSQKGEEISLCIVGEDAGMRKGVEMSVSRIGLRGVKVTGRVDKSMLLSLYSCADVLVLPSSYEAFGIVLLEAMAHGVPVVATDVGGITELLEDGKDGLLVPYGDVEALRSGLAKILRDNTLRTKFVEKGKQRAKDFMPDIITKRLRNIYVELTKDKDRTKEKRREQRRGSSR